VTSWRVDETYVKVGGQLEVLVRAVDKHGGLIDFMLADRRNTHAAHRFLGKALTTMRHWPPSSIVTRCHPDIPFRKLALTCRLEAQMDPGSAAC
jgi:transposase-like protein